MFKCDFGNHISKEGEPLKLVVTQWREKEYPAIHLKPLPGTNLPRRGRVGKGFEAAEVKKACGSCDARHAPVPATLTRAAEPTFR